MPRMADRVRDRWSSGEVALNAWCTLAGPEPVAALAAAGFDAVTVDLQHGATTIDRLGECLAAIEGAGAVPFVRVPWNDAATIMRVLDLGARGVICPMINSATDAEALVRACRYPPLGIRSYGPVRGAFGSGWEQARRANDTVFAFAQIETAEGLEQVEAICGTAGLDGVYVGPADLSLALGLGSFADLKDPDLAQALDRIVTAARAAGIVPGLHAPGVERAIEATRLGFGLVGSADAEELLRSQAVRGLRDVRGVEREGG
jgi:4-hydroxy-2-oxoheptanedioate aldolase